MIEQKVSSWTDAIIHFFETEIKNSDLYKAREAYFRKVDALKNNNDIKKEGSLKESVDSSLNELNEIRARKISDDIKNLVYEWAVRNMAPYVVPAEDKLITKVTHPLKFAHSADLNTGICDQSENDFGWISTAAIKDKTCDLTLHNGAIIQLVRFLGISYKNYMIYDLALKNDFSFLDGFQLSNDERIVWQNQFKAWIKDKEIKTAGRAKQVYFPVSGSEIEQKYDLLVPLHSSTLSYELYKRTYVKRFSESTKQSKEQKSNEKYHGEPLVIYPNFAALEYGNGQPQNISLLNTVTNGKSYHLPCFPPKYKKITKPLFGIKTVFERRAFGVNQVKDVLTYMSEFLVRFSTLNLSVKEPDKRAWLDKWCTQIIEEFFQYVYGMHDLGAGWTLSKDCKLSVEYQLLLDPFRDDESSEDKFLSSELQLKISNDFANWLNRALERSNEKFTGKEWHLTVWSGCFAPELRLFVDEMRQLIKMKEAEK